MVDPTPRTWLDGELVTPQLMNQEIRDAVEHLLSTRFKNLDGSAERSVFRNYREYVENNGSVATLTVAFAPTTSSSNVFKAEVPGELTVNWSNIPGAGGNAVAATLICTSAVTSVVWPAGTRFPGGSPPGLDGETWFSIVAIDGAVTVGPAWSGVA